MHVIATAGHVDHGKSTLVRALTGMEPDRWVQERRRGMSIDLGYCWTTLPSGETVAFVDVPGHQRFIGNMLAGLGPAPAVMLIIAADEGWREQSTEHVAAAAALGIRHGLVVVTKTDLADPAPAAAAARRQLRNTALADVEIIAVSAVTGNAIPHLQAALSRLIRTLPAPRIADRVRLWVDRAFTIRGSGTVVTGTLVAGTVLIDDQLGLRDRRLSVRGLQSLGVARTRVSAVSRVAINLRSLARDDVRRGDTLLTPDVWRLTGMVDVRLLPLPAGLTDPDPAGVGPAGQDGARPPADSGLTGSGFTDRGFTDRGFTDRGFKDLPAELTLFVGTASVPVRVRALDSQFARLTLDAALPLQVGDHAILSDRTRHHPPRGVLVLDPDPVPFGRRGAAAARVAELTAAAPTPTLRDHLRWRGAVRIADLRAWGVDVTDRTGVRQVAGWLIDAVRWTEWTTRLTAAVDQQARLDPQNPALPIDRARSEIGAPDRALIVPLAVAAGLQADRGEVGRPDGVRSLGDAEGAVREVETRLRIEPFAAPDREDLDRLGLSTKDLATAAATGRLLRVDHDIVLLPDAPARAMRILSTLPGPFTTSQARQALVTSRRVVIPLLEYLDREGWTQRLDSGHRKVLR